MFLWIELMIFSRTHSLIVLLNLLIILILHKESFEWSQINQSSQVVKSILIMRGIHHMFISFNMPSHQSVTFMIVCWFLSHLILLLLHYCLVCFSLLVILLMCNVSRYHSFLEWSSACILLASECNTGASRTMFGVLWTDCFEARWFTVGDNWNSSMCHGNLDREFEISMGVNEGWAERLSSDASVNSQVLLSYEHQSWPCPSME